MPTELVSLAAVVVSVVSVVFTIRRDRVARAQWFDSRRPAFEAWVESGDLTVRLVGAHSVQHVSVEVDGSGRWDRGRLDPGVLWRISGIDKPSGSSSSLYVTVRCVDVDTRQVYREAVPHVPLSDSDIKIMNARVWGRFLRHAIDSAERAHAPADEHSQ